MNEREKLLQVLSEIDYIFADGKRNTLDTMEFVADYILSKGVIALPDLKHNQEVFVIYKNKVKALGVSSYMIRPEYNNLLQIHLYKNGFNWCCTADDFGKTVFITKEEAEKALEGGAG